MEEVKNILEGFTNFFLKSQFLSILACFMFEFKYLKWIVLNLQGDYMVILKLRTLS